MSAIFMMLTVAACYTITSMSDKYAVAEAKFTNDEFTFLMCSSMSVFLILSLPFQKIYFHMGWQSVAAIGLIAICKMLEFQMSARVLRELSAFELKAWLGITLFLSYIMDVVYGEKMRWAKLVCISVTVAGLVLIAKSARDNKVNYRKIAIPLLLYLISKFGYGLVIKAFTPYVSSIMQLLPAMVIISLLLLPKVSFAKLFSEKRNSALKVICARIPNTIGMVLENMIIAISLSNYSFIQPMVLTTLFLIGVIRREKRTWLNLAGSLVAIIGIVMFQFI